MKIKLALCLVMSMSVYADLKRPVMNHLHRKVLASAHVRIKEYPFKSFTEIPGLNYEPRFNFRHCEVIDAITKKNYSNEGHMIVAYTAGCLGFPRTEWYSLVSVSKKSFATQKEKHLFFEKQFMKGHGACTDFRRILKELLKQCQ